VQAQLHLGVELFDRGEYWHAHEAWEDAWRADDAPDRDYHKGLIQLAAACWHLRRCNHKPLAFLLTRARHHLTVHDDPRWPFEREALLELIEELADHTDGEPLPLLGRCRKPGPVPPMAPSPGPDRLRPGVPDTRTG
jgi:hypothetical protein